MCSDMSILKYSAILLIDFIVVLLPFNIVDNVQGDILHLSANSYCVIFSLAHSSYTCLLSICIYSLLLLIINRYIN